LTSTSKWTVAIDLGLENIQVIDLSAIESVVPWDVSSQRVSARKLAEKNWAVVFLWQRSTSDKSREKAGHNGGGAEVLHLEEIEKNSAVK
jgi:hypothetical protein